MKIAWLDVETTGTDPMKNDIVTMALIIEIDGIEVETFMAFCQPYNWDTIESEALEVNELTIEQIKQFPDPREVHEKLVKFLGKYVDKYDPKDKFTLAGQYVSFDADFLREWFVKAGDKYYGSWFNYRHIDLIAFVRLLRYAGRLDIKNDRLSTICESCGVELTRAHNALADIRATKTVLVEMMRRHLAGGARDE